MKQLAAKVFDAVCNWWLARQRAGHWVPLDKIEFREMQVTFSQFGEDLAVRRIAAERGITRGFYVDAGAFHPSQGSNTLLLYKSGWRGINVEMVQEKIALFDRLRPLDRNICAALDREERPVHFSTDQQTMDRIYPEARGDGGRQTMARTLDSILEAEGLGHHAIDYLNIDCEGADLRVLQGLDLKKHPVQILTIEALDETAEQDITAYLTAAGMIFAEKIKWTLVFVSPAKRLDAPDK